MALRESAAPSGRSRRGRERVGEGPGVDGSVANSPRSRGPSGWGRARVLHDAVSLYRDLDHRWGRSAAAEAIELAAVPLGGASSARIPAERRGVPPLGPRRRRWAMVDDALGGKWRSHPLVDDPHHLEDTPLPCESGLDTVAHPHRRRRLGGLAVHAHMPAAARRCGRPAGLDRSYRPEPPVHARRIPIARARHERQATATARGLPTTARHRVELLGAGP